MKMSTQFTVSVQMLLMILIFKDKKITSDTLSESTGANPVMIRQLYKKLKDADILNVSTGMGVTTLLKRPEEISLWDIYMAVEEYNADDLFKFHPKISGCCQIGRFFKNILTPHLDCAIQAMGKEMSKISLAQLAEEWKKELNRK